MEGSVEKLEAIGTSMKPRSSGDSTKSRSDIQKSALDRINSLSRDSRGPDFGESKNKRSRKEGSIGNFNHPVKRRRNRRPRSDASGLVSDFRKGEDPNGLHDIYGQTGNSHNQGSVLVLPAKEQCDQALSFVTPRSLDGVDANVNIPKRPRGIRKRRKTKSSTSPKRNRGTAACSNKSPSDIQITTLPDNPVAPSQAATGKQTKVLDGYKEVCPTAASSNHSRNGVDGANMQDSRRKKQKRKLHVSRLETNSHRVDETLIEDDRSSVEYFLNYDDDENLEQNAARMLSSRFDPLCNVVSKNGNTSSRPANKSSSKHSHQILDGSASETVSVHDEGRSLRPRKNNHRGFIRKRRHFYEVRSTDMDPYWVVKQRIRVFWPLDQSWYFGLVKEYDPVTKLHYVKYDDREEEWINLQNERFKLLLFPSELKFSSQTPHSRVRKRRRVGNQNAVDATCAGSIKESETIISWLARSNHSVKLLPDSLRKWRRSSLLKEFEPSILSKSKGSMAVRPLGMSANETTSRSVMQDRFIEGDIVRVPKTETRTDSYGRKLACVYFRKRFKHKYSLVNKADGSLTCVTLNSPVSLPGSIVESQSHSNATAIKMELISFKLNLPLKHVLYRVSVAECSLLVRALLFHQGKLIHVWPMVHMEIGIVDSALGLRMLSFEGCLRRATSLVCLIMATVYKNSKCSKSSGIRAPLTSIGFKLSGIPGRRYPFVFTLCSFIELKSSRWRYLDNKLKQHCRTTRKLSVEDCTFANLKKLSIRSNKTPNPTLLEYAVLSEVIHDKSCSDIMHQQILTNSACWNMYPGYCYFYEKCGLLPSVPSFSAGPSFFLTMHLKMLVEKNASVLGFRTPNSTPSQDCTRYDQLMAEGCSPVQDHSNEVSEAMNKNVSPPAVSSGLFSFRHLKVVTDARTMRNNGDCAGSFHNFLNGEVNMNGKHVGCCDSEKKTRNKSSVGPLTSPCHEKSQQFPDSMVSLLHKDPCLSKLEARYCSPLNTTVDQSRLPEREQRATHFPSDLVWEINEPVTRSPSTIAPRSTWHRNRHSPVSPTFGQFSKLWPADVVQDGFVNASRKPRTHVSYLSLRGDCEHGSKSRTYHRNERLYNKIRTDNAKRTSGVSERLENCLASFTCCANILITTGDKGWRECGVHVVLDSDDQKEWRILVKILGTTKYVYKAPQFLQPGTTNRYTHAMMWKGGKDWSLEFTERSQWSLFKVMHEECFNRNIRVASVKNIPIPGVRLIDDVDENIVEVPFVRNSSKYHRQVESEIDLALNPSHVLYDMDSDDEEWISTLRSSSDYGCSKTPEFMDDMFERVIDTFEKLAYTKQCDIFTSDVIAEIMPDFDPVNVGKATYEYWREKRKKKGLPLIRQFQPILWEHYQKQLKEWELAMGNLHSPLAGYQQKAHLPEKPPMFAFCLRPRGWEVPNKGSVQKSHRKFMFSGHHGSFLRGHDGLHGFGKKSHGISVGEEEASFPILDHDFSCSSNWRQSSYNVLSEDATRTGILAKSNDSSDTHWHSKLHRSNLKKTGKFLAQMDSQPLLFTHNDKSKKHEGHCWDVDIVERPDRTKQLQPGGFQKYGADLNAFRLHDSAGAAQHAANMAKLKRERAQWLLHKADLALHKAMIAVMTAEAIKASQKNLIDDG